MRGIKEVIFELIRNCLSIRRILKWGKNKNKNNIQTATFNSLDFYCKNTTIESCPK